MAQETCQVYAQIRLVPQTPVVHSFVQLGYQTPERCLAAKTCWMVGQEHLDKKKRCFNISIQLKRMAYRFVNLMNPIESWVELDGVGAPNSVHHAQKKGIAAWQNNMHLRVLLQLATGNQPINKFRSALSQDQQAMAETDPHLLMSTQNHSL